MDLRLTTTTMAVSTSFLFQSNSTDSSLLPFRFRGASNPSLILSSESRNNTHPRLFPDSSFSSTKRRTGSRRRRSRKQTSCQSGGGPPEEEEEEDEEEDDIERALHMDGTIPGTSHEFLKQVSSRAYDMRRNLHQTLHASSYDVLENNPWREASKPVYVLTQRENQICTMKTRRNRSEVERELGLLFSKGGKRRPEVGSKAKQSTTGTKFRMLVEDISPGVLVFEDEQDAARYCNLLQGEGQGCEGVAELEASSVFDICHKMRALAVLFRRGRTPPLPESLKMNLRARNRSLEDREDLI